MKSLSYSCQGESHKATDKPCQDFSYAVSSPALSMAIVSDGHGGERYFRSDRGSRMAVNITRQAIHAFVENMQCSVFTDNGQQSIFEGSPFYAFPTKVTEKQTKANKAMNWLFSSIISQWNTAIYNDAITCNLTEWELQHVDQQYLDEFIVKQKEDNASFEKTYGCTLMAYVQTPEYWFAFQIGDGKCVFINRKNNSIICEQLIPWDERCFLNKTTSLCDSEAINRFRYCFQADGNFPVAVFLGSDGMDDSFGDGDRLHNFYIKLYKQIAKSGANETELMLRKTLPSISKVGSKDDMSVACVYDDIQLRENFFQLTQYQEEQLNASIQNNIKRIETLRAKVQSFGSVQDESDSINLAYAKKDLDRAGAQLKQLYAKVREIHDEIERFKRGQVKNITKKIDKHTNTLWAKMKK